MTRTQLRIPFLLFAALALAPAAFGSDVWLIRVRARGQAIDPCEAIRWQDNAAFYNTADVPAVVRLLDVSNGATPATDVVLQVAPHAVAGLQESRSASWDPVPSAPIWVAHLDVPDSVRIESRLEISRVTICGPPSNPTSYGVLGLPAFFSLVPAGQQQVHLGADLNGAPDRINVALFNAAESSATAAVQVFSSCSNELLSATTATVPPRSLIQLNRLASGRVACESAVPGAPYGRYVVITLSQPGFSYATGVIDDQLPSCGVAIALTH